MLPQEHNRICSASLWPQPSEAYEVVRMLLDFIAKANQDKEYLLRLNKLYLICSHSS